MTTDQEVWCPERRRAWLAAAYARRFALIARRCEFQRRESGWRARFALTHDAPGPLHLFDAAQVIGASELDVLCGYAVEILSSTKTAARTAVLDLLGILDPIRVAGIYFALPPAAQEAADQDGAWVHAVHAIEPWIGVAQADLRDMVEDTPTSEVGLELARVDAGLSSQLDSDESQERLTRQIMLSAEGRSGH